MVSHLKGNSHRAAVKEINKKITDAEMVSFINLHFSFQERFSSKIAVIHIKNSYCILDFFSIFLKESFSNKYISEIEGVNLKKQKEKDERDKTFKKKGKKLKTRMANKLV